MKKFLVLGFILLVLVYLRFWQLEERFIFSGETNNILYAIEKLVNREQSPLLGLVAAEYVQHLFHSPWYLYLMVPIFFFSGGDPLAFAVFHSLLGVIGTYLLFRTGEMIHSTRAGLLAAALNAVWMMAIRVDREVWSVGLVPWASIAAMYLAARAYKRPSGGRFILLGVWLGVALSFHYQVLVMVALILGWICWQHRRYFWAVVIPIVGSLSPLIIFDLRHDFFNATGMWYVVRSIVEGSKPYSSKHFLYQFHRPLLLVFGIALAKMNRRLAGGVLVVFSVIQLHRFLSYRAVPNYAERSLLVDQLVDHWDDGLEIFFEDRPSYEFRYLLNFKARQQGLQADKIVVYEPWQTLNSAQLMVVSQGGKDYLLVYSNSGR